MSWSTESIEILRWLIDDVEETPTYSDERLLRVLLVAGFQVANYFDFTNDYTINIVAASISPDPTATATREDAFVNLMTIKAACIIERGKALTSTEKAIAGKEFYSSVDYRGIAAAKKALLDKGGWCSQFDEEADAHMYFTGSIAGAAILGPFRTLAGYPGYATSNFIETTMLDRNLS